MDLNMQDSIFLSHNQFTPDGHASAERVKFILSNPQSSETLQNAASPSSNQSPQSLLSVHQNNPAPQLFGTQSQKTPPNSLRLGKKRATLSSPKIFEINNQARELTRNSIDNPRNLAQIRAKALQEPDAIDSPYLIKEYRYRKISPNAPIVGEQYLASKPSERRKDRALTLFSIQNQSPEPQKDSPPPSSRTPSNASRSSYMGNRSAFAFDFGRNSSRFSQLNINNASMLQKNWQKALESSDEEVSLNEDQLRIRKIFKKGLYAVYFIGVMFSFRTRVKMLGALRPIEYLNAFEEYKEEVPKYSAFPFIPSSTFSLVWTFVIIVLLIITAILTPVYVSFVDDDNELFYYLNLAFDIGFGVDMMINFLSAYYDEEQKLVRDYRLIALNYLKMWFWIDMVAILPFDQIILTITQTENYSASGANKLLRLLRFPRLYRMLKILRLIKMLRLFSNNHVISKIIKELNLNIGLSKILKIFINFAFLNHVVGCLWFFIAKLEDFSPDTWVGQADLTNSDVKSQYVASLYWAFQTLTTVGYGDITPGTQLERIICTWWPVVCVTVYSFLVGNLAAILMSFDKRSDGLKDRLASFKLFALEANLPEFLRQKVQRFIEINDKENSYYGIDPTNNFKDLPVNLRTSLLIFSYYASIKNIKLLQVDPAFTAEIIVHLRVFQLKKGEILYREDDPSNEIFFISTGSVKFITERAKGVFSLSEGTYFGEIEVLNKTKRQFFCQSESVTNLLVCSKEAFLKILVNFPQIDEQIRSVAEMRKSKLDKRLEKTNEAMSPEFNNPDRKVLYKMTDYVNKVLIKKTAKVNRQNSIPSMYARSHVRLTSGCSLIELEQKDQTQQTTLMDRIKAIRARRQSSIKKKHFMKKALSQILPFKEDTGTGSDNTETNLMQSPVSLGLLKKTTGPESFDFTVSQELKQNGAVSDVLDRKNSQGMNQSGVLQSQRRLFKKMETIFFEEDAPSEQEKERNPRRVRFEETPQETPLSTMRLINQNKTPMFSNDLLTLIKKKNSNDSTYSKEDQFSS